MGTRADFYIGRGEAAEWLGSIAWDGYPDGIKPTLEEKWPEGGHLFESKTEEEFKDRLNIFFQNRDDVRMPKNGWPWPWDDSRATDYAYAFDGGKVYASCFGSKWFDPTQEQRDEDDKTVFPNMEKIANVTGGGFIVIT